MALNATSNEKEAITEHAEITFRAKVCLNPLHPNISMHILHTVLYTFLILLTKRTCLTIESRLRWCVWADWWNISFYNNKYRVENGRSGYHRHTLLTLSACVVGTTLHALQAENMKFYFAFLLEKKFHDIHMHSIFSYDHFEVMLTVSQQCDLPINCDIF